MADEKHVVSAGVPGWDFPGGLETVDVTLTMTGIGFRCLERRAARLGMRLGEYVYHAFINAEFLEEKERAGAQVAFEMPDGTTDRRMWFYRCSSGGVPSGPCLAKMGVWCWDEPPDDNAYEACGCGACFVRKADLEAAGCG